MTRFVLKRLGLALITLWLLSVIVFVLGQVLPSDPGRSVLGPLAEPSAVPSAESGSFWYFAPSDMTAREKVAETRCVRRVVGVLPRMAMRSSRKPRSSI